MVARICQRSRKLATDSIDSVGAAILWVAPCSRVKPSSSQACVPPRKIAKSPSYPAACNVCAPMIERVRPAQCNKTVVSWRCNTSILASSRLFGKFFEPGRVNLLYSPAGLTSTSCAPEWSAKYCCGVTSKIPGRCETISPNAFDQTYSPCTKPVIGSVGAAVLCEVMM